MAKTEIKHNILFFPDKEKATATTENTFTEVEAKTGKEKHYNYDAKITCPDSLERRGIKFQSWRACGAGEMVNRCSTMQCRNFTARKKELQGY